MTGCRGVHSPHVAVAADRVVDAGRPGCGCPASSRLALPRHASTLVSRCRAGLLFRLTARSAHARPRPARWPPTFQAGPTTQAEHADVTRVAPTNRRCGQGRRVCSAVAVQWRSLHCGPLQALTTAHRQRRRSPVRHRQRQCRSARGPTCRTGALDFADARREHEYETPGRCFMRAHIAPEILQTASGRRAPDMFHVKRCADRTCPGGLPPQSRVTQRPACARTARECEDASIWRHQPRTCPSAGTAESLSCRVRPNTSPPRMTCSTHNAWHPKRARGAPIGRARLPRRGARLRWLA